MNSTVLVKVDKISFQNEITKKDQLNCLYIDGFLLPALTGNLCSWFCSTPNQGPAPLWLLVLWLSCISL